jgi:hypothetical protein
MMKDTEIFIALTQIADYEKAGEFRGLQYR